MKLLVGDDETASSAAGFDSAAHFISNSSSVCAAHIHITTMALQAARRKHCDKAHPYQQKLKDGISLLGRDTPAFILEEVRKRQAKGRGTSSLRSKLAAEYGWRHANFVVKRGIRLTPSSNDKNSWGYIAQRFTTTKRRPASAHVSRAATVKAFSVVDDSVARNNGQHVVLTKAASAREGIDGSSRSSGVQQQPKLADDGPISLRPRTAEVHAVVGILQETENVRSPHKVRKGLRKKAAEVAATAAERRQRSSPAASGGSNRAGGTTGCRSRVASSAGGRTQHHHRRARPANAVPVPFKARPKSASVLGNGTPTKQSTFVTEHLVSPTRRSSGLGGRGGHDDANLARCFVSSTPTRRRPHTSTGNIRPVENIKTVMMITSAPPPPSVQNHLSATDEAALGPLGVIDMSKLTTTRSQAQVSGYTRDIDASFAFNRNDMFNGDDDQALNVRRYNCRRFNRHGIVVDDDGNEPPTSNKNRANKTPPRRRRQPEGSDHGKDRCDDSSGGGGGNNGSWLCNNVDSAKASSSLAHGITTTTATNTDKDEDYDVIVGNDCSSSVSTGSLSVPETKSSNNRSEAGPDGDDDDEGWQRQRQRQQREPRERRERRRGRRGGENSDDADRLEEVGALQMSHSGSRVFTPQLDCFRGSYAQAVCASKSSRNAAKNTHSKTISQQSRYDPSLSPIPTAATATGGGEGGGGGGGRESNKPSAPANVRGAHALAPWRERFQLVQKRRAVLEATTSAAAEQLVVKRAEKEGRIRQATFTGGGGVTNTGTAKRVSASVSVRGAMCFLDLRNAKHSRRANSTAAGGGGGPVAVITRREKSKARDSAAAKRIQHAFRQHRLWVADKYDRELASQAVLPEEGNQESGTTVRSKPVAGVGGLLHKTNTVKDLHAAIRTKRMIRCFVCCTKARLLILKLLWDRVEGEVLGERRTKRAAVESRAAVTVTQIAHIRRIAVGLIKLQSSAKTFKLEHQSKQAKKKSMASAASRNKRGVVKGVYETAKQARSEQNECDAILRDHGRRGRRLVDMAVRDKFLTDLLYSYRRQHVVRDLSEYLMETNRPPFVDSRDVKRMLACPMEEMHMFSDPTNYRTRPRYTRFVLPFREIEGLIQDAIANELRSEYRDKCKVALGAEDPNSRPRTPSTPTKSPSDGLLLQHLQGNDDNNKNNNTRPQGTKALRQSLLSEAPEKKTRRRSREHERQQRQQASPPAKTTNTAVDIGLAKTHAPTATPTATSTTGGTAATVRTSCSQNTATATATTIAAASAAALSSGEGEGDTTTSRGSLGGGSSKRALLSTPLSPTTTTTVVQVAAATVVASAVNSGSSSSNRSSTARIGKAKHLLGR